MISVVDRTQGEASGKSPPEPVACDSTTTDMSALSPDNINSVPHVVIVETKAGVRLVEFKSGQMKLAHRAAQKICSEPGFEGRVMVAARVRQCSTLSYVSQLNLYRAPSKA